MGDRLFNNLKEGFDALRQERETGKPILRRTVVESPPPKRAPAKRAARTPSRPKQRG